jgi:hypothetical protein
MRDWLAQQSNARLVGEFFDPFAASHHPILGTRSYT